MTSAVLIVSDAAKAAGNALGESMGWGPNNYSVALSPSGSLPATHWGCRVEVSQGFFDLLANPPKEAIPVIALVEMDFRETEDKAGHFQEVAAGLGLQVIVTDW